MKTLQYILFLFCSFSVKSQTIVKGTLSMSVADTVLITVNPIDSAGAKGDYKIGTLIPSCSSTLIAYLRKDTSETKFNIIPIKAGTATIKIVLVSTDEKVLTTSFAINVSAVKVKKITKASITVVPFSQ